MLGLLDDRKRKLKEELDSFDLNPPGLCQLFTKQLMLAAEVVVEVRAVGTRKTRATASRPADERERRDKRGRKAANNPILVGLLKDHEIYDDISYFRRVI